MAATDCSDAVSDAVGCDNLTGEIEEAVQVIVDPIPPLESANLTALVIIIILCIDEDN